MTTLAIHYANPAAQQLLAKLPQIVWYTVTGTVELLLIKYRADARSLEGGRVLPITDVTLVIDGRSHILSVTAQRMPDGMILLEMAPMDKPAP